MNFELEIKKSDTNMTENGIYFEKPQEITLN